MFRKVDVLLVGGGIVSATLASLLQRVKPSWSIEVHERLEHLAMEASNGWHNAGTGHAALCELNYTPIVDGQINISKALKVHNQFLASAEYWSSLVQEGALGEPSTFINSTPHLAFGQGVDDAEFLKARQNAMARHHFFKDIKFSTDPETIKIWAPLLVNGRDPAEQIAASYAAEGTDVDFGSVTRQLFADFESRGGTVKLNSEVTGLNRQTDGTWQVAIRNQKTGMTSNLTARTVLLGAGGWALKLLRAAGAPEVKGYGLLPISGRFLSTELPEVVENHRVKVYGRPPTGAPPMSVPHLDARVIDGKRSVLFGPFAGVIPRFLKASSNWDFIQGLRPDNLWPLTSMGVANLNLLTFLIKDLASSTPDKIEQLQEFLPSAVANDWFTLIAGQRAQIVKPAASGKGVLQFGTEVVTSAEGTLAGVLGASPGASTAVAIALDVLKQCYPNQFEAWASGPLRDYLPSIGHDLISDAEATNAAKDRIRDVLQLEA